MFLNLRRVLSFPVDHEDLVRDTGIGPVVFRSSDESIAIMLVSLVYTVLGITVHFVTLYAFGDIWYPMRESDTHYKVENLVS